MATIARPRPDLARADGASPHPRLVRTVERLPDLAVVLLATWTPVYHLCLLLRLGAGWAVGLEVVALLLVGLLRHRARRPSPSVAPGAPGPTGAPGASAASAVPGVPVQGAGSEAPAGPRRGRLDRGLLVGTVVVAVATALLLATGAPWWAVAVGWLVASLAGTSLAVRRLRRLPAGRAPEATGPARTGVVPALVAATALALLSVFTRWPNPDDLYYVNLSQWVVDHGTFPLRDTIFSDLRFPMSSWPPVASYDLLAGTAAWLAGVKAASVVYFVVPPVATFLSVLALWRLLRAWRVPMVGLALLLALLFLLADGGEGYAAPGNLFLIRLWQGKVVLLCLLVPTLLVHALRYVERPTRGRAGWLLAGGTAAVGLSTTAMFLVPVLAVAGAAPLLRRRPGRALLGAVAMAAYPLAAGAVTVVVGGRSADDFDDRKLYRFDPDWFGHEIFRTGPVAVVGVAAVLLGVLLVPHRAARLTTGVLVVVTGVTFVPGVTQLGYDVVGLGPTLWRVSWVATVAALVGVLGAVLGSLLQSSWGSRLAVRRPRRAGLVRWVPAVAVVVAMVVGGVPIWSDRNGVSLAQPQWKRGPESVLAAERVLAVSRPGDVVLVPEDVAITIAVTTTEVKTVAPRDYFMDYLRGDPDFFYDERSTLLDFVGDAFSVVDADEIAHALDVVGVDLVCLPSLAPAVRFETLDDLGWEPVTRSPDDVCFAPSPA